MTLRLPRQRAFVLPTSILEAGGQQVHRLSRRDGFNAIVRRVVNSDCSRVGIADCQRRFTQVVRGKSIPFFQRSITSTPNRLGTTVEATLEEPDSFPQAVTITQTQTTQPEPTTRIRSKSTSKSPTLWTYLELGKPRLAVLVLLTPMSAYALAPYPASLPTLLFLSTGTFLCIASANTFNMISEPQFDAMMSRTRNPPLVRNAPTIPKPKKFGIAPPMQG